MAQKAIHGLLIFAAGIGLAAPVHRAEAQTGPSHAETISGDARAQKAIDAYIRQYSTGNSEDAKQALASLVCSQPRNVAALEALGLMRADKEQYVEALAPLQQAYHLSPKSLLVLMNLGDVYLKLQRFNDAEQIFAIATRLAPASAQSCARHGQALMGLAHYGAASDAFAHAVKLAPLDVDYQYNWALALYSANLVTKAAQVLDQVPGKDNSATAQALWADIEERQGHFPEAIRHYHAAASLAPSVENIHALGLDLLRHGMFPAAKKVYSYGRSLFPGESEMEMGWALAEYGNNEFETAATDFSRLLEKNPQNGTFQSMLQQSCKALMGQAPPACKSLIILAAQHPEREALVLSAVAYLLNCPDSTVDDLKTAEEILDRASRAGVASAEFYYLQGVLDQQRMLWDKSIAPLKDAIRINPMSPEAHYRLAQAYFKLGRREEGNREISVFQKGSPAAKRSE